MRSRDTVTAFDAMDQIHALIDEGNPAKAIEYAESLGEIEGHRGQIVALAYTDAGTALADKELIAKGVELWRTAGAEEHTGLGYNLANGLLELFQLEVRERGFVSALSTDREQLGKARRLFIRVADDLTQPAELRVQALTNLANSLDMMARDIDAIEAYDRALAIDPKFGMALGNKGLALLGVAPLASPHQPTVLRQAAKALDAAIVDADRVVSIGGPQSLESFIAGRADIAITSASASARSLDPLGIGRAGLRAVDQVVGRVLRRPEGDPHFDEFFRWTHSNGLFLHVSMACVTPELRIPDPVFFRRLAGRNGDERRVADIIDAFNAVKQDFAAARYLLWLATSDSAPTGAQTRQLNARAGFLDSGLDARWGLRTGLAVQAFAAATNVLDKVACLVHLYLESGRSPNQVTFRYLWHPRPRSRNAAKVMDARLAEIFDGISGNSGMMALADLSSELADRGRLSELVERRHSATHRYLVVHDGSAPSGTNGWLDRVDWPELVLDATQLLKIARAAIVYAARLIDVNENYEEQLRGPGGRRTTSIPRADAER